MKVKDLLEVLTKLDPEAEVIDAAYMSVIALMNEMDLKAEKAWVSDAETTIEQYEGHPDSGSWGAGPDFPKGHS